MYLQKIVVENIGPCSGRLQIDLAFTENGAPKPLVLVGRNGSGKTTLLANVVDALIEFQAQHFVDVLPYQGGGARAFFKISGATNRRVGSEYAFSYLKFIHSAEKFTYVDKVGSLTQTQANEKIGETIGMEGWQDRENCKLTTTSETLKSIVTGEVHAFFPAHRSEAPNWLNSENETVRKGFSVRRKIVGQLCKPLLIVQSAEDNVSWLLDVILDQHLYKDTALLEASNTVLRGVMDNDNVRFGVGPRLGNTRVAICDNDGTVLIPSISHLSGGQATLLNLALTILRYGDAGAKTRLEEVAGIVLIDEIENHLHTRLQVELLPKLLKAFPKIQFIITSHSPLFLLGLEKQLSPDSFAIHELPTGRKITAGNFSEYEAIVSVLAFKAAISGIQKDVIVLVEGMTDKRILEIAWGKLRPNTPLPCDFLPSNGYQFIRNTLIQDDLYQSNPTRRYIGLMDFDGAFDAWNSMVMGKNDKWIEDPKNSEEIGLLAFHPNRQGYVALLPVPSFRKDYASRQFGGASCICIELLFEDQFIQEYLTAKDLPLGGKRIVFKGDKKAEFAAAAQLLTVGAFKHFGPIFALIDDILQERRSRTQ